MKILIVDDSPVMRKLVLRAIRQAGFGEAEVVEADDGAMALEVAQQEQPNLILADWNMPNMTGIEMLRSLRSAGDPVIVGFVTSESTAEIRSMAQEAGASFFLSKPIDTDKLSAALGAFAA
jgi:two-component system chemotaxis response regulator CheY